MRTTKSNSNHYENMKKKNGTPSVMKKVLNSFKSRFFRSKGKPNIVRTCSSNAMPNFREQYEKKEDIEISAPTTYSDKDYTSSVVRMSDYIKIEDPMKSFYNFEYMCDSSVSGCKLYTCNSIAHPENKYVMKVTKLNDKNLVIDTENELKLMRACSKNKNIAKVRSVMGHDNRIWIAMDYCEHGSLYQFMEKHKSFDEYQIAYICKQILNGLNYLHQDQSIMHLDIKSDNILVDKNFIMMITDFGSSVQLDKNNRTFDKFRGTPYWMAPEVIPKDRCFTNKADVWSFGILVWELMHGKPPRYDKDSLFELLLEIKYEDAPQLSKNHTWSPELVNFLYRALDKNPETRWSATQLLSHPFLLKASEGESNTKLLFPHV